MNHIFLSVIVVLTLFMDVVQASSAGYRTGLTYHGKIIKPDGNPLEGSSVVFSLAVYSPGSEACLLYSEHHTKNMNGSNGNFSLEIGAGTRSDGNTHDLKDVFRNRHEITGLTCSTGNSYEALGDVTRKLVVQFTDGGTTVTLDAMELKAVPFAISAQEAESLKPSANIDFGNFKITNLGAPSATGDAATKKYVDDALAGVTGVSGSVGMTGATGAQGVTGATGVAGVTGSTGVDGITGATGLQGVTGSTGVAGVTGATGAQGPTGEGFFAATGASGAIYYNGGNIGVGTTAPSGPLHVAGQNFSLGGNPYTPKILVSGDGSNYSTLGVMGESTNTNYARSYIFLGTTNSIAATGANWGGDFILNNYRKNGANADSNLPGDVIGSVTFRGSTSHTDGFQNTGVIRVATDSGSDSRMEFRLTANTGAATNPPVRMSILDNGNVGIGTTGPLEKLHIVGTSGTTLRIVDGNQGSNRVLASDANGSASWRTLASLGSAGPTGVTGATGSQGITGPTGSNGTNGTTGATGAQGITGATGVGTTGATGATGAQGPTGEGFFAATGASGAIYYNGGNIGIGISAPNGKLDLRNAVLPNTPPHSSYTTLFNLETTYGGTNRLGFRMRSSEPAGVGGGLLLEGLSKGSGFNDSETVLLRGYSDLGVANEGTFSKIFEVGRDGSGYFAGGVGIGTTAPSTPLHVNTAVSKSTTAVTNAITASSNDSTNPLQIVLGIGSNSTAANNYTSIQSVEQNVTWRALSLNPNGGNVGIGTTTPNAKLQVNGTITGKPAVLNASATIDFGTGNQQYTTADCGLFDLHNMKDGASYAFAVQGGNAATCSFNAFSDAGLTGLSVHLPTNHGSTTNGTHTLYNFMVMGTHVYVSWQPY